MGYRKASGKESFTLKDEGLSDWQDMQDNVRPLNGHIWSLEEERSFFYYFDWGRNFHTDEQLRDPTIFVITTAHIKLQLLDADLAERIYDTLVEYMQELLREYYPGTEGQWQEMQLQKITQDGMEMIADVNKSDRVYPPKQTLGASYAIRFEAEPNPLPRKQQYALYDRILRENQEFIEQSQSPGSATWQGAKEDWQFGQEREASVSLDKKTYKTRGNGTDWIETSGGFSVITSSPSYSSDAAYREPSSVEVKWPDLNVEPLLLLLAKAHKEHAAEMPLPGWDDIEAISLEGMAHHMVHHYVKQELAELQPLLGTLRAHGFDELASSTALHVGFWLKNQGLDR